MNNNILVKIEGKNVLNYIKWLIKNKINIIDMKIVKHNILYVTIDYQNYALLKKYSKTYKVSIIKKYGRLKLFDIIKNNIVIISSIIISIIFLYYISGYIFSVDIIYNNKEIVSLINKELNKYDIKKFSRKKDYHYLEKVKNKILKDNNDVLEWLEIEEEGTKYIIRLVERKKSIVKEEYNYQSIIAKKDAIISNIQATSGEKIKKENEYVHQGETIISGIITKPNETKVYKKASGIVLGEVWYKIEIEYPLYYQEESLTGKTKKIISLYFLNKEIPLLPYKKYKHFNCEIKTLFESIFIPSKLTYEKIHEVNVKEDILTMDEATNKAINLAKEKLINSNNNIKEIKNVEILNKQNLNSKIKLNLFISAIEDITKVKEEIPNEEEIVEN